MAGSPTGLQASADGYTYWSFPQSSYITLVVMNNGVDVAFGTTTGAGGPESAAYGPTDEYYPPGTLMQPRIFDAVRIKSHVAGASAQYSIAARLENELPGDSLGGSFSPTYVTVDPVTGAVSANFSGHVHAQGLDLDAGVSSTPPTQDRVRWIRQSDGAVIADLYGSNFSLESILSLRAYAHSGDLLGVVDATAVSPSGAHSAGVTSESRDTGIPYRTGTPIGAVTANGGGGDRVLADSNGASDFLQLVSTRRLLAQVVPVTQGFVGGSGAVDILLPTAFPNTHIGDIFTANIFQQNVYIDASPNGLTKTTLSWGVAATINGTLLAFGT